MLNFMQAQTWNIAQESKSLHRSRAGRHFCGTENEIWAGFGPVGNTEKKDWGLL